jgi:hypothetical protein
MSKKLWLIVPLVVVILLIVFWRPVINVVRKRTAQRVLDTWLEPLQKVMIAEYLFRYEKAWTPWLLSMIAQESGGDPEAVNPRDPSYGLMAITPDLLSDFNRVKRKSYTIDDLKIPYKNLEVGLWFFDMLFNSYRDYDKVVMAYNAGQGNMEAGRPHLERVKEFFGFIQPQLT